MRPIWTGTVAVGGMLFGAGGLGALIIAWRVYASAYRRARFERFIENPSLFLSGTGWETRGILLGVAAMLVLGLVLLLAGTVELGRKRGGTGAPKASGGQ